MIDLSILIPSRNEMFLKNTIEDIIKNREANTEVIVVLDGAWSDPPLEQYPDVNVIYVNKSIGQRAATNLGAKLSKAKFLMKCDAHCSFDKGFDRKMIEGFEKVGDDVTMVPIMRNLWAFDWKCLSKNTKIVTPVGLKDIEDIEIGEEIISGDGNIHKVIGKTKSIPKNKMIRVVPYKLPSLELTEDHLVKVYAYEKKSCRGLEKGAYNMIVSNDPLWIEAGKLKEGPYCMIFPFPQEEKKSEIDSYSDKDSLVKLLGYFMAEGTSIGDYKLTFSLNQKETDIADEISAVIGKNFINRFGKSANTGKYMRQDPRNTNKFLEVKVYAKEAVSFVKKFVLGNNARNKKFVPEILTWPKYLQKILLDALVTGDGYIYNNRKNLYTGYVTASKELAYQVFIIMLRLGYLPSIYQGISESGFGTGNMFYRVGAYSNRNGVRCKSIIRDNEYIVSVLRIEESDYSDFVYDLTIDGLPEILTESGIVHNCRKCGKKWYQGPTPTKCKETNFKGTGVSCDSTKFVRKIMWVGKHNPQSTSYCFDATPHFQYFEDYKHRPQYIEDKEKTGFTETMSLQGSCFMCTRKKYWELELCGEELGNWGNQGIEVACKTWLSGGRVLCNHNTWYAHMFRTQGGDFGFPYHLGGRETERTKANVKDLFWGKKHPKQIHPVSWLVRKFWPVPGWTEQQLATIER
jgi:intein/homing endonuclease